MPIQEFDVSTVLITGSLLFFENSNKLWKFSNGLINTNVSGKLKRYLYDLKNI